MMLPCTSGVSSAFLRGRLASVVGSIHSNSSPDTVLSPNKSQSTQIHHVRYYRRKAPPAGKPHSLPPAKGKRYTAVNVPWGDPEEVRELLWRRHVYQWSLTSIRQNFRQVTATLDSVEGSGLFGLKRAEETEFEQILEENKRTNEKMMDLRLTREEKELEDFSLFLEDESEYERRKARVPLEWKTAKVKEMIVKSSEFITKENALDKINEALENSRGSEFYIDVQGNQYAEKPPLKYPDTEGRPIPPFTVAH